MGIGAVYQRIGNQTTAATVQNGCKPACLGLVARVK
jgi:hypothetical protein